ncbi:cytochrome bc1 complex cytochrome b subunit [Jongsikchunia kroppenstedtii]|uniref:cytochrome bc1 complex cytochrome b subunit n=1 Tax=Jongsikchunia kroppenstedtii TaxID=1121721 RepID=UPI0003813DDB|nr:cytochrome bc complex cytochrome b subunit [Jongsikchunia kroppenstedtii]
MSPTMARQAAQIDARYHAAAGLRRQLNKVFPSHWSFLLGEIALYSFIVLLLSGIYLSLFFDPSMAEVTYHGAYQPLNGVSMSRAYESALDISFEVRGGLVIRQIHHWAALLFAASIILHMLRIFFTGAFRRPREANWLIGVTLLILAMFEGFTGYTLPDDLLSGTGLRALTQGMMSIPVIGTWLHWTLFGGDFPGQVVIPRLYIIHILLFPGIILALIGAHLALVWYQKHTQFPGVGRTERNVVGQRIVPVFALKSGAFFAIVFGVLAVMAGLFQINPVWALGPYSTANVSAGAPPDFYLMWTDGLLRLVPDWEVYFGNAYMIPAVFWGVLIISVVFATMFAWPFIERRLTKDVAHHNLLQRPRDVPVRTAVGAAGLALYLVLTLSCMNDTIALKFHVSLNAMTWIGRIGCLVLPPLVYFIAYRWALALQRSDRATLEHGIETGIITRRPHGEYIEIHQPLGPADSHDHPVPLPYQGAAVPKRMNKLGAAGRPGSGGLLRPDPPLEQELAVEQRRAATAQEHRALATLQRAERPTADASDDDGES